MRRYSTITPTVRAPSISEIQARLVRASLTVRRFVLLFGIAAEARGKACNTLSMEPSIRPKQSVCTIPYFRSDGH